MQTAPERVSIIDLIEKVRRISAVPIIASGGAGKVSDFVDAAQAGADALLAASVFHSGEISIAQVKQALEQVGIEAR